ncbi:YwmB family TATA-box binding protein [Bacillus sp. B190/17]|uniref:YwmB family TATA-box binding protein n=1 Tax=Bacillus lumedeiriae TaxID=3058829 RepID=A0ABW8I7Z3_9BACI
MNLAKNIHYILLGCLMIFVLGNNTNASDESSPLLLLTDSVKSVDGLIEEWALHTRERLTEEKPDDAVRRLQTNLTGWKIGSANRDENVQFTAARTKGTVHQKVQVVSSDTDGGVVYVLYSVTAADEEEMRTFLAQELKPTYSQIFHSTPQIFTCIKGKFDDKLEEVLPNQLSKLLSSWEAEKKEAVFEKNFYSLSAYSTHFISSLSLPDHEMNVQVGLRKDQRGEGTNFVIGTPLITIEY